MAIGEYSLRLTSAHEQHILAAPRPRVSTRRAKLAGCLPEKFRAFVLRPSGLAGGVGRRSASRTCHSLSVSDAEEVRIDGDGFRAEGMAVQGGAEAVPPGLHGVGRLIFARASTPSWSLAPKGFAKTSTRKQSVVSDFVSSDLARGEPMTSTVDKREGLAPPSRRRPPSSLLPAVVIDTPAAKRLSRQDREHAQPRLSHPTQS